MRRVTKTALADQDHREILEYLSDHSERAAEAFTAELADSVRLLAGQPRMGRQRDDLAAGVRSSVVGRYVVLYRFTDEELQILRIIHGSRDIPRLFGDPG